MSVVIPSLGNSRNCDQLHVRVAPFSATTENSQALSKIEGVGPADKTGKSFVRYWPGGRAPLSRRRLPTNPGVVSGVSSMRRGFLSTFIITHDPGLATSSALVMNPDIHRIDVPARDRGSVEGAVVMSVQQEVGSVTTLCELNLWPVDSVIAKRRTRMRERLHHKRRPQHRRNSNPARLGEVMLRSGGAAIASRANGDLDLSYPGLRDGTCGSEGDGSQHHDGERSLHVLLFSTVPGHIGVPAGANLAAPYNNGRARQDALLAATRRRRNFADGLRARHANGNARARPCVHFVRHRGSLHGALTGGAASSAPQHARLSPGR